MDLKQGFEHFLKSDKFKELSNIKGSVGGMYRGYKTRFYQDKLKHKAITQILEKNGYEIKNTIVVVPPKTQISPSK